MKNVKDIGKNAIPHLRQTMINTAPGDCIGGCPKCGDYMAEVDGKAVCDYCEYSESMEDWNKRD